MKPCYFPSSIAISACRYVLSWTPPGITVGRTSVSIAHTIGLWMGQESGLTASTWYTPFDLWSFWRTLLCLWGFQHRPSPCWQSWIESQGAHTSARLAHCHHLYPLCRQSILLFSNSYTTAANHGAECMDSNSYHLLSCRGRWNRWFCYYLGGPKRKFECPTLNKCRILL